jgi:predicted dehydrogenase
LTFTAVLAGCGAMSKGWLSALADHDLLKGRVRIVGLVDLDRTVAEQRAAEFNLGDVVIGSDLDAVLAQTKPDLLFDVAIPAAREAIVTIGLRHGCHVLSEKPMATSIAAGRALVQQAADAGRVHAIVQNRRFIAGVRRIKRLLDSGALGELTALHCDFFVGAHFGGFREEMDNVLLLDMAIHPFDSVRYLLDRDPVAVYCESFNPSWSWYRGDAAASAIFEFEGGIRYVYTGSWCAPGLETSWNGSWRVSGAEGSALWNGDDQPTVEIEGQAAVDLETLPGVGAEIAGSLSAFVSALRTGVTPDGEVHGNVMSLAMVEAAIESKDKGARISIDDVLERAFATAVADEKRDDVRAQLESWTSVRGALQGVTVAS